uniref:LMBR1-like conserved region-containing protein n=1 Tax=Hirondellea gigas TaxID=1518452 RepID=A0A6A7G5U2_9CRUS
MVDAFMIISAVVLSAVILFVIVLLLIRFSHPDDKNEARFPKAVVILGLFIASAAVLTLPFDVANAGGGDIDVGVLWQIIFITAAVFIVVIIPFAFFFYESDVDPDLLREQGASQCEGQAPQAMKYTCLSFVIFTILVVIMYVFMHVAEIRVERHTQNMFMVVPVGTDVPQVTSNVVGCSALAPSGGTLYFQKSATPKKMCHQEEFTWEIPVTFPVYLMALLAFIGWFLFSLFVGIGLFALPLDLFNDWRTRPERMTLQEYSKRKNELGIRARSLREIGTAILDCQIDATGVKQGRKNRRQAKKAMNEFEQAVYMLQKDIDYMNLSFFLKGGNPIMPWFKLFLSIFSGILSLTWLLHILLFMLFDVTPFLNDLFINLEFDGFPLFGVVAFAIYSFYLLWCCIAGNFKLGLRIPFIMKIYPMELGNTMMNAFLVNTWIILVCSFPCVQFCTIAFPIYSRGTSITVIFGNQVKNLQFFKYFFKDNVFVIAMLILSMITLACLCLLPKDKSEIIEQKLEDFKNGKKRGLGLNRM